MDDLDRIKRRIRSLLELAKPGSGATDPERASASAMADKMIAASGLTEADIPEREIERPQPPPPPPPPNRIVIRISSSDSTASSGGFGYWTIFGDA